MSSKDHGKGREYTRGSGSQYEEGSLSLAAAVASLAVVATPIVLDVTVLGAFVALKAQSDPLVVYVSLAGVAAIFGGEWISLRRPGGDPCAGSSEG